VTGWAPFEDGQVSCYPCGMDDGAGDPSSGEAKERATLESLLGRARDRLALSSIQLAHARSVGPRRRGLGVGLLLGVLAGVIAIWLGLDSIAYRLVHAR
jgi:hypothetical protein